jgi:hypothetical protein
VPTDGRRLAILASSAALAALVTAALAVAGTKLKTSSATGTAKVGDSPTATAKCKKGTKAASGGFESLSDTPTGLGGEIHESRRDGRRKWTGSSFNPGSGSTLTVFAYCRDEKVKSASADVAIAADVDPDPVALPTGTATATCPRGTKVISGGFDNPDFSFIGGSSGTDIRPYESFKSGKRTWTVSASDRGDEGGTLVAYAYCHKGKTPKTKQATETLALGPGGFPLDSVTARCKKSQRVVSGGFASDPVADVNGPFFTGSRRDGKRKWIVTAAANLPGPAITTYAYCEKK